MANLANSLKSIRQIPGNIGSALVDVETGMSLAQIGGKSLDLDSEINYCAQLMRAKAQVIRAMNLGDSVEEIVITSQSEYRILCPVQVRILKVKEPENLFFFVALKKSQTPLAPALSRIKQVVSEFAL
jgi:predicted regulator of Ras-like GTPase activity (Roadblock/LC7/MglB family)